MRFKGTIVQSIGVAIVAALISIVSINAVVFSRHEGNALSKRVDHHQIRIEKNYDSLNTKIDKNHGKLVEIILLLKK